MRKLVLCALFSSILLCLMTQRTLAQEKTLRSSPQAFQAYFAKFMSAVHRGDKNAVASMTEFPLAYGFDAGDEGKYSRQQFLKRGFTSIFGKSPKKFLPERDPIFSMDGRKYTISIQDAAYLTFVKKGNKFLLSSYIVEP